MNALWLVLISALVGLTCYRLGSRSVLRFIRRAELTCKFGSTKEGKIRGGDVNPCAPGSAAFDVNESSNSNSDSVKCRNSLQHREKFRKSGMTDWVLLSPNRRSPFGNSVLLVPVNPVTFFRVITKCNFHLTR